MVPLEGKSDYETLLGEVLDRVEMPRVESPEAPLSAIATLMGSKEKQEGFADAFAQRLRDAIAEHVGEERYAISAATIDASDHADCEDVEGERANAFATDQRCYRIIVSLVPIARPGT